MIHNRVIDNAEPAPILQAFYTSSPARLTSALLSMITKPTLLPRSFASNTEEYKQEKERTREILLAVCQNFLILLPKQLGCSVCQYSHALVSSPRFHHYLKRKEQIENLISLIEDEYFCEHEAKNYLLNIMPPFTGTQGKHFFSTVETLLDTLIKKRIESYAHGFIIPMQ